MDDQHLDFLICMVPANLNIGQKNTQNLKKKRVKFSKHLLNSPVLQLFS